jgi:excisionase family DNA binding protein
MNEPRPEDRIALLEKEVAEMRALLAELARKQQWPQYLTVDQVAEMLQLSPRTIHDMVSQDRIPYHKAGNATRFLISEIVAWTASHRDDGPKAGSKKRSR